MKHTALLLLMFIYSINTLYGQSVIKGKVIDEKTKEPLMGVIVTIRQGEKNSVLKFTRTEDDGTYMLELPNFPEKAIVHFSMMSFETKTYALLKTQNVYNAQLKDKPTKLSEVSVKAPKIRQQGDTLIYSVASFAKDYDKSLADVLKKLPGIEVSENGAIKHNGKMITNFYIEGKDMLGGRYGLATKNINQKDVATVEVMEEHQSIKAFEGLVFSENPAVNIKLKEGAKTRWVGTVKAGGGYEPLSWIGELMAMRFTRQYQTMNIYKTNNVGVEISKEGENLTMDDIMDSFNTYRLQNYISLYPRELASVDAERHRFNKSHMGSLNVLWPINKEYDLTTQIDYSNSRLDNENVSHTEHFLENDTIVTDEVEDAFTKKNNLAITVKLLANTPTLFLSNKLESKLNWDHIDMGVMGTYSNKQKGEMKYRSLSNDLRFTKRNKNKAFSVSSLNMFQQKPQELFVRKGEGNQHQTVNNMAFFTKTNTTFSFYINPFTLSVKTDVSGVIRNMDSQLEGLELKTGSLSNDVHMRYLDLSITPELEFNKSGFKANLSIPVSYIPYFLNDRIEDDKLTKNRMIFSPRLYLSYGLGGGWEASLSGGLSQRKIDEQQFYRGLILRNYRNLSQGFIDFKNDYSYSASTNWVYKDILNMLFFNVSLSGNWGHASRTPSIYFIDDYIVNTYQKNEQSKSMWMLSSRLSKGISSIDGMVSLQFNGSTMNSTTYQNDKKNDFRMRNWRVSSDFNSRIMKWMDVTYKIEFAQSRLNMKDGDFKSVRNNVSQSLLIILMPRRNYNIKINTEHYYNELTEDLSKNFVFADIDFNYSFKKGWEVGLGMKNVFNKKNYDYTIYDGLSSIYQSFNIRPRNIMATVSFRY